MKKFEGFGRICRGALLLGVFVAGTHAHGQAIPGYPDSVEAYDPREVSMLPRYCIHTQLFRNTVPGGANPELIKRWYSTMGDIFHAMHHYCWGLMKTNRALLLARTKQAREFYLNSSIGEFDYVIDRAPKDFALLPEIHTKKGKNLILLGRAVPGVANLNRAIELKADYWPPFVELADYYRDTGNPAKAREVLENGLVLSPDSTTLKSRLADLRGTPDKSKAAPKPSAKAPADEAPEKDAKQKGGQDGKPAAK